MRDFALLKPHTHPISLFAWFPNHQLERDGFHTAEALFHPAFRKYQHVTYFTVVSQMFHS